MRNCWSLASYSSAALCLAQQYLSQLQQILMLGSRQPSIVSYSSELDHLGIWTMENVIKNVVCSFVVCWIHCRIKICCSPHIATHYKLFCIYHVNTAMCLCCCIFYCFPYISVPGIRKIIVTLWPYDLMTLEFQAIQVWIAQILSFYCFPLVTAWQFHWNGSFHSGDLIDDFWLP